MADRSWRHPIFSSFLAKLERAALKPFVTDKRSCIAATGYCTCEVDAEYRTILTEERIRAIVDLLPDEWLATDLPKHP